MEMVQAHRPRGLDLLHERYGTLLKSVSMRVLHNEIDAEDLLQDVFLEIWLRGANYSPLKGRPLSWIVTLTRRRSIDRLRRRECNRRFEERFAEEIGRVSDAWTHVHEDIALGEMNVHVKRALAALPEAQQKTIRLAYHHQMSQREIARHTGTPLGTIKTRLELGLRKMASSLSSFGDLLPTNPLPSARQVARGAQRAEPKAPYDSMHILHPARPR